MTIPYRSYPVSPSNQLIDGQLELQRPVIEIQLTHKNGKPFSYLALIDSGADYCLFHASIGEQMGLEIKKGKPLNFYGTSGRNQTAYFHEISFSIQGQEIKTMVGFSTGINSLSVGLLGQQGFFDQFKIEFDLKHRVIEIN